MPANLAAASALWGASILLSRVIGIAREAAMGRILGVGGEADAYFVAFILPDAVNYLVAGGALTLVFGPIYGKYLAAGDEGRASECYSVIANFHLVLLGGLVAVAWLAAPTVAPLLAPGFEGPQLERIAHLMRILLPAQVFHVVGGLLSASLQTRERHSLPALSPLVYTLGVVAGGLVGGRAAGAEGFAWGVLAGAVAGPFALNLYGALAQGLRWRPLLSLSHPDLRSYLGRALPIMLALSIVAVDDWILRRVGTSLGAGAVTTLSYAKQLMRVPMGIFGVAAGIAAFPVLIRLLAAGDRQGAYDLVATSVRRVLVLALGAQVALTAAGPEVSRLVYGGRIPAEGHLAIGSALGILSTGLWAWAAQNVLARGFYAEGNTWLPSVVGTAVAVLVYPGYAWAAGRWGIAGLAGASAVAISVYGLAMALLLRRELGADRPAFPGFALRIVPAVALGLAAGWAMRDTVAGLPFAVRLLAPAAVAFSAYAAAALLFNVREAHELLHTLLRTNPDAPDAPLPTAAATDTAPASGSSGGALKGADGEAKRSSDGDRSEGVAQRGGPQRPPTPADRPGAQRALPEGDRIPLRRGFAAASPKATTTRQDPGAPPPSGPALRLILTGGGTGGHVYPLLEMHRLLAASFPIDDVLYVGIRGRADETLVRRAGLPFTALPAAAIEGRSPGRLLPALARIAGGTLRAAALILRRRPHLVLASGGYVSAPVCFAAFLLRPITGTRVVVHEQNVMPGLMNRMASLFADVVMTSSRETPYFLWSTRCLHTGYPVRGAIAALPDRDAARAELGIPGGALVAVAFGGSMGSRAINRAMPGAAASMELPPGGLVVIHATGLGAGDYRPWDDTFSRARLALAGAGERPAGGEGEGTVFLNRGGALEYRLVPYLHRMDLALAAADLVVCRAGAGALAELAAAGRAAVVVPKRGLPGDHQELNAISLAEAGGCLPVFERRAADGVDYLAVDELASALGDLAASAKRREELAAGARAAATPEAGRRIVETVRRVVRREPLEFAAEILVPRSVRIRKQVDTLVDFLRRQPPESFYRALYAIKMEELLAGAGWRSRNDGIKLAGALGRADRIPELLGLFRTGNGYMRRNVLRAIDHIGAWRAEVGGLLVAALEDPYFEVRAQAFAAAARFRERLGGGGELTAAMVRAFRRPRQHLEVRVEALRTLPLFLPVAEYRALADRFRFVQNVRLRQAVLEGLAAALRAGLVEPAERQATSEFVGGMLITTSGFAPRFHIRESFVRLQNLLAESAREEGRAP